MELGISRERQITESVPSFARYLNILVVDDDAMSLVSLAAILEQFTYNVTTTELATAALDMIREQKGHFKLVMANISMPDMECAPFMRSLHKLDIPVVLMSSEKSLNIAGKALGLGACFFLNKPVSLGDLKYVWQHAFRKRKNPEDESPDKPISITANEENANSKKESQGIKIIEPSADQIFKAAAKTKNHENDNSDPKGKGKLIEVGISVMEESRIREIHHNTCNDKYLEATIQSRKRLSNDEKEVNSKEKRSKVSSSEQISVKGKEPTNLSKEVEEEDSCLSISKSRAVWSPDLHLRFTAALSALGDKCARPKAILRLMNVPNLTQRQVSSHLQVSYYQDQKYKAQVSRICEAGSPSSPSVGVSISNTPAVRNAFAQPLHNLGKLPFQQQYSPDFGVGGHTNYTMQPTTLVSPNLHTANFANQDHRTLNQNMGYAGMSARNSMEPFHSYLANNYIGDQAARFGGLQRPNRMQETGNFSGSISMNQNGIEKQQIGFEGNNSAQFINLPNMSVMPQEAAVSPNMSAMFQLLNQPNTTHQDLDFAMNLAADPFISQVENRFQPAFNANEYRNFAAGNEITSGNAPNSDNFLIGYTNGDQNLEAVVGQAMNTAPKMDIEVAGQAPPVCPINLDQVLAEDDDLPKILGVCNEPNPGEVDQYCEWLSKVLLGDNNDA